MKKQQKKQKKAFTLIELIVVITILAILGTIAFIALQGYSSNSRDSVRLSDISNIKTALEMYSIETGSYPTPNDGEVREYTRTRPDDSSVTLELWKEGTFNDKMFMQVGKISKKPVDPLSGTEPYIYSKATNLNQYEILINLEDEDQKYAFVNKALADNGYNTQRIEGNYNGYYVKAIDIDSDYTLNKVVLLATPSIITGSITEIPAVTDGGQFPVKLDGKYSSGSSGTNLTIKEIYAGANVPKEDEEVYEFTENLKKTFITDNSLDSKPDYKSLYHVPVKPETSTVEDFVAGNEGKTAVSFGRAILGTTGGSIPTLVGCNYGDGVEVGNATTHYWYDEGSKDTSEQCSASTNAHKFYCDNGVWKDDADHNGKKDDSAYSSWNETSCSSNDQCGAISHTEIQEKGTQSVANNDEWKVTFNLDATHIDTAHAGNPLSKSQTNYNYIKTFSLSPTCEHNATWNYGTPTITGVCVNEGTGDTQYHKVPAITEDKCEINKISSVETCTGTVDANATKHSTNGDNATVYSTWNTGTNTYVQDAIPAWSIDPTSADETEDCKFVCNAGYTWDVGTTSCIADTGAPGNCGGDGTLPANSVNTSTGGLTTFVKTHVGGGVYEPASMDWTHTSTAGECTFECATNYYWDADTSACVNWCQIDGSVGIDNCTIK